MVVALVVSQPYAACDHLPHLKSFDVRNSTTQRSWVQISEVEFIYKIYFADQQKNISGRSKMCISARYETRNMRINYQLQRTMKSFFFKWKMEKHHPINNVPPHAWSSWKESICYRILRNTKTSLYSTSTTNNHPTYRFCNHQSWKTSPSIITRANLLLKMSITSTKKQGVREYWHQIVIHIALLRHL